METRLNPFDRSVRVNRWGKKEKMFFFFFFASLGEAVAKSAVGRETSLLQLVDADFQII